MQKACTLLTWILFLHVAESFVPGLHPRIPQIMREAKDDPEPTLTPELPASYGAAYADQDDFVPAAPGALPYIARVAKDVVRVSNPFKVQEGTGNIRSTGSASDDYDAATREALDIYASSDFGKASALWRRLDEAEVVRRFKALVESTGGDSSAAVEMSRKCRMLLQLQPFEVELAFDKWVDHFGGDRADAVESLRKNPNLLLSEPSGPVEVTKALTAIAGLFNFGR